jgi:hypothetical protein
VNPLPEKGAIEMKRTTRKELFTECRKILAKENLTEEEKAAEIKNEVTVYVEDITPTLPEYRALEKRLAAIERKYSGDSKHITFCPKCCEFSPKDPPEVEAWSRQFAALRARRIAVLVREVRGRKAA